MAPQRGEIHRAVTLLRQAPPHGRTLTDLVTNLQDLALREALGDFRQIIYLI
jgi:hypothetical protein